MTLGLSRMETDPTPLLCFLIPCHQSHRHAVPCEPVRWQLQSLSNLRNILQFSAMIQLRKSVQLKLQQGSNAKFELIFGFQFYRDHQQVIGEMRNFEDREIINVPQNSI